MRIDGSLVKQGKIEKLRQETVWVDPSVQIWNRSLYENLTYGSASEVSASMEHVLEEANLFEVLQNLPDGLQSKLGENGGLVSGGEGQRVRIGRAIHKSNPRLVVLDEPFSGLERDRRRNLLTNLRHRWQKSTLLCVTHDISDTLSFEITNAGGGTLSGILVTEEAWIDIMPTSFEGPRTTINVTVDNEVLNMADGNQHTGAIDITSNGGDTSVTVMLTATCVLPRPNPYNPGSGPLTFFGDGIVEGQTKIRIYTLSGEKITEVQSALAEVNLNLANGIYIYTYESPREKGIGKFTVINK